MRHLFDQVVGGLDNLWVDGVISLVFVALFIAWVLWAYSSGNRERLEEAARMPLLEDDA